MSSPEPASTEMSKRRKSLRRHLTFEENTTGNNVLWQDPIHRNATLHLPETHREKKIPPRPQDVRRLEEGATSGCMCVNDYPREIWITTNGTDPLWEDGPRRKCQVPGASVRLLFSGQTTPQTHQSDGVLVGPIWERLMGCRCPIGVSMFSPRG